MVALSIAEFCLRFESELGIIVSFPCEGEVMQVCISFCWPITGIVVHPLA